MSVNKPGIGGLTRSVIGGLSSLGGGADGKASVALARLRDGALVRALTEKIGDEESPLHAAVDAAVSLRQGNVAFDLSTASPDLLRLAPASVQQWVRDVRLDGQFPVARRAMSFRSEAYFRPRGHRRAFYRQLPEGGVIAFKGSEILADDLDHAARDLADGRTYLNLPDVFIMKEQKIPLGVGLQEATSEATKALGLYASMHRVYGERPDLPLPLLVVGWPEHAAAAYRRAVLPTLSDTARGMVERYIRDGFGMYVYYFPRSPQRVRHFSQEDGELRAAWHDEGRGPRVREDRMRIVEGWVRLLSRMLCAGYFPASLTNQLWGCCVQDQNVCVEGGFVDVDSIERLEDVTDPRLFAGNLLASVQMLAGTVTIYLSQIFAPAQNDSLLMGNTYGRKLAGMICMPQMWEAVRNEHRRIVRSGVRVDPRLSSALEGDRPLDTMATLLTMLSADPPRAPGPPEPVQDRVRRFLGGQVKALLRSAARR